MGKWLKNAPFELFGGGDDLVDARGGEALLDDEVLGLVEEPLAGGLSIAWHEPIVSDCSVCYKRLNSLKRRDSAEAKGPAMTTTQPTCPR